jgi:SAM-dependent methyltransferase
MTIYSEKSNNYGESDEEYSHTRKKHWDSIARAGLPDSLPRRTYHKLLCHYYQYLVSPGQKILELGCGCGDLLAALSPFQGVGVDFSEEMIALAKERHPELLFISADVHTVDFKETFDVIILSDLINDLWDVQRVFRRIRQWCHADTRIILNFWSKMWQPPLSLGRKTGRAVPILPQNWFATEDVKNLLELENFEVVKHMQEILCPLPVPFVANLCNRYIVKLPGVNWFALTNIIVARLRITQEWATEKPVISVIVPARNEAGNIKNILERIPEMGGGTELLFVEGNSTDGTYEAIEKLLPEYSQRNTKLLKQPGKGKGDAVRAGFNAATGDILMILDADLTVPPEDLLLFYEALISGKCEFVNGVRLVYPMENEAMRFFNLLGNKGFSIIFSWLIGQPIKDTLCGTKVLSKLHYECIAANQKYFGDFDPFGDFDLLFGAAKQNFKIMDLPIRYHRRTYGDTNIDRWRHGWLLLKMILFAARRIKFV